MMAVPNVPRPPNPIRRKGVPWPYIVVPQSDTEATCGTATLVTPGQAQEVVSALVKARADTNLIEKFENLVG